MLNLQYFVKLFGEKGFLKRQLISLGLIQQFPIWKIPYYLVESMAIGVNNFKFMCIVILHQYKLSYQLLVFRFIQVGSQYNQHPSPNISCS